MAKLRKQNFFNTIIAALKMATLWILIIIHLPIVFLLPRGKISTAYMSFIMWTLMLTSGIKIKVNGKISTNRPLLIISNHISVFELVTFAVAFGTSFFGKKEVEKFPIIGPMAKKLGVIFLDRNPMHAMDALKNFQNNINVGFPMTIFPEGTTTNGAYVKQFKSTLFSFVENSNITVQPVVINYRYKDGSLIDDNTMAEHFAYFDNKKQDTGPLCSRERSAFGQVFHIMVLGGFTVEMTVLPTPQLAGMNRKEIAASLHKIISDKYIELKD